MKGFDHIRLPEHNAAPSHPGHEQFLAAHLKLLQNTGLLRILTEAEPVAHGKILINKREFLNFASNDYLGLCGHASIARAAIRCIEKYGIGSGASRLLSGTHPLHCRLEERIAEFKGTERAVLFNTGYAANTGLIPAISSGSDIIFSDELNHASIIDGTRLSKARVEVYRHGDVEHLEHLIHNNACSGGRKFVVTDSVFSMDGDIAPLKEILELCNECDAILIVDDAHGTGVLGRRGRGALEFAEIESDRIIQMGTLSKAAGCYGAFVAGSGELASYLVNTARSFIYSTSLPPSVAASGIESLRIMENGSSGRRKTLWKNRKHLCNGLQSMGYDTMESATPIIPVAAGDEKTVLELSSRLLDQGIFAPAIRPPTVPEGMCRIRFTVTAAHKRKDIDYVLQCMSDIKSVQGSVRSRGSGALTADLSCLGQGLPGI